MPKKSYMDKSNILNESFFKASEKLHEGFLKKVAMFVKNLHVQLTYCKKAFFPYFFIIKKAESHRVSSQLLS